MENIANVTKLTREEWLELRKKGIGGSDAAAACGLNPWKSKAQLFFEKTGQVDGDIKENEVLRQGRDLEDYVAKRFTEATGKKVRRNNFMMADTDHPFLIADIDREVVGENSILECKTTSPYNKDKWKDGQIPIQYELQCHHYMMVTGAERCYIACLVFSTDFFYRVIERDEETIAMLKEQEIDFWQNYVLKNEIPAPDGSSQYDDALKKRFKGGLDEKKEISIGNSTLKDYFERKSLIKALETQNKEVEQDLKLQLGDFNYGENEFVSVSYKPYVSNRFDSKKFKEDEPELYKKYVKQSEGRRFSMKEKIND